jgi:uncharacterized protein (TIGR03067 family)
MLGRNFIAAMAISIVTGMAAGRAPTDAEAIRGTWLVSGCMFDGKDGSAELIERKLTFIFGDRLAVSENGERHEKELRYKLDPTRKPPEIDITPAGGKEAMVRGIYRLEGDKLKLCVGEPGEPRPVKFETKKDNRVRIVDFRRQRP